MAFKLSGVIDFDAKGAKSELGRTKKAVDGVKQSSDKMNRSHKTSVRDLQMLATAANSAETEAKQLAAAERLAAKEAIALSKANRRATANTANLMAQFNDIGVMMASGQSPLQLALQQGTQITQVIGPLGAAGAAKALSTAFVRMLNPISFVTIGAIAAAAAFSNWLTGADEEVATLDEIISDLTGSVSEYTSALKLAKSPMKTIKEDFGDQAVQARAAFEAIAKYKQLKAKTGLETSIEKIGEAFDGLKVRVIALNTLNLRSSFGGDMTALRRKELKLLREEYGLTEVQARLLSQELSSLTSAKGIEEQAAAAAKLGALMSSIVSDISNPPTTLVGVATAISTAQVKALELVAAQKNSGAAALASAKEMLQTLGEQNAIRAAANMFGEESAAVAFLRKAGEKAILEEQLAQLDVSEGIKNEIRGAWEAGQVLNATEMSDGIKRAADEAKRIADEINRAVSASQKLASQGDISLQSAKLRLKFVDDPVELARRLGENKIRRSQSALRKGAGPGELSRLNDEAIDYGNTLAKIAQIEKERRDKIDNAKSGGRKTQKQVDALSKLIEKEQLQIALLRETDPLQKEMLRNREALAAATDQERAAVEAIIAQRINEQKAIDQITGKQELLKDTLYDAFEGLILQGERVEDVLKNIVIAMIRATAQALLLGTGPLGSILGGKSGGGALGDLAQIIFPKSSTPALAGGGDVGLISGPGSGTSDDILMWGSSGEFMVNAKATQKHRHLLEAINSGGNIPGFAAGGPVTPSYSNSSQNSFDSGDGKTSILISLTPGLEAELLENARGQSIEITHDALDTYDRHSLPLRVNQIAKNPMVTG
ncbi:MAG: phage tail length tape measure family protein [Amylibacter sp.]|nr:phage tail length tape measure family protein [Amylibacter sp.]